MPKKTANKIKTGDKILIHTTQLLKWNEKTHKANFETTVIKVERELNLIHITTVTGKLKPIDYRSFVTMQAADNQTIEHLNPLSDKMLASRSHSKTVRGVSIE